MLLQEKICFYMCKRKEAIQLCRNSQADQRLCFHNKDSTVKFQVCPSLEAEQAALVRNPEDRFSHDSAHLLNMIYALLTYHSTFDEFYTLQQLWSYNIGRDAGMFEDN